MVGRRQSSNFCFLLLFFGTKLNLFLKILSTSLKGTVLFCANAYNRKNRISPKTEELLSDVQVLKASTTDNNNDADNGDVRRLLRSVFWPKYVEFNEERPELERESNQTK